MASFPSSYPPATPDVSIYDCEVHLRFRLIEDGNSLQQLDQRQLLAVLLEAYSYGEDEYLEVNQHQVTVEAIAEAAASPTLRRQIMRLRNASDLA